MNDHSVRVSCCFVLNCCPRALRIRLFRHDHELGLGPRSFRWTSHYGGQSPTTLVPRDRHGSGASGATTVYGRPTHAQIHRRTLGAVEPTIPYYGTDSVLRTPGQSMVTEMGSNVWVADISRYVWEYGVDNILPHSHLHATVSRSGQPPNGPYEPTVPKPECATAHPRLAVVILMSKGVTPLSYGWAAVHLSKNQNHATTFLRVTPKEGSTR